MFKVSFKETPKNPSKLVTKMGNETTVILRGTCELPDFFKYIPEEIMDWIAHQVHVEGYEDMTNNQLIIYAKGISKCHPDDKYDTVFGERMAESRAKECIYKFFCNLCWKLEEYYRAILFGNDWVVHNTSQGVVGACTKYEKLWHHERHHQIELLQSKVNGN